MTSVSRRRLMELAALAGAAVTSAGLGGARAADNKVPQAEAKYQPRPRGIQRCEICLQFEAPNRCKIVAGDISQKGWCQYFAARENAQ